MTKRDSEPVASPQATRPEKCESPYHRPTSIYCLDCLPGDAPLGALLLSNRTPTQADVDRAVEIQALLDARKPAAQPAAGTTPPEIALGAERGTQTIPAVDGVCRFPSEGTTPQAERCPTCDEQTVCGDEYHARAVAPVETPQPAKLMVTRGGEIHEECPDCRGECSPYKPAVETRLTAEQFHKQWDSSQIAAPSKYYWYNMAEAFRDKSEAGLRFQLAAEQTSWHEGYDRDQAEIKGLREEIERLKGERAGLWHEEREERHARERAEAEVAALRERERQGRTAIPTGDALEAYNAGYAAGKQHGK